MIVDQYSRPVATSWKFAKAADIDVGDRPWEPMELGDIDQLIPAYDRRTLVAVSRSLCENWGPARAIARQIPMYSVGAAWKPSNKSKSKRYSDRVEEWMRERFWPRAVIGGVSSDMTSAIYLMVLLLVRDGEYFILKTKRKDGFPAIQIIPSHQIGQRTFDGDKVEKGRYKGNSISDGIITNKSGQVIAYRWLGKTEEDDKDLSARSVIHRAEADYPEAKRGYPAMAHGLNDGRDSLQSHAWERFNMLFRSSRTILEHSETGAPDNPHPNNYLDGGTTPDCNTPSKVELLQGGTTQHFRAGTGSKLEVLKHENPGEIYESYNNRMIRMICVGVPWPYSFAWEGNGSGGGTSERKEIEQARRTIADIQATIEPDVREIAGYATAVAANMGLVPQGKDWWRWSFSKPAKLTIDDGRVSKATLEMHARGLVSDNDILEDLGKDPDEYWPNKFNAWAKKKQDYIDTQEREDVEIDSRVLGMWTPNDKDTNEEVAPVVTPSTPPLEEDDSDD